MNTKVSCERVVVRSSISSIYCGYLCCGN